MAIAALLAEPDWVPPKRNKRRVVEEKSPVPRSASRSKLTTAETKESVSSLHVPKVGGGRLPKKPAPALPTIKEAVIPGMAQKSPTVSPARDKVSKMSVASPTKPIIPRKPMSQLSKFAREQIRLETVEFVHKFDKM